MTRFPGIIEYQNRPNLSLLIKALILEYSHLTMSSPFFFSFFSFLQLDIYLTVQYRSSGYFSHKESF